MKGFQIGIPGQAGNITRRACQRHGGVSILLFIFAYILSLLFPVFNFAVVLYSSTFWKDHGKVDLEMGAASALENDQEHMLKSVHPTLGEEERREAEQTSCSHGLLVWVRAGKRRTTLAVAS